MVHMATGISSSREIDFCKRVLYEKENAPEVEGAFS